jgi:hypothetical protein
MEAGGTVVQVDDGRGFISATKHARYVVTAAHCVGKLPDPQPARYSSEITYQDFIGPLGEPRHVWAECVFMDPIADIAVFGSPYNPALWEEAQAYEALTEQATPFRIGKLRFSRQRPRFREVEMTVDGERRSFQWRRLRGPSEAASDARMLSLDGTWFSCRLKSPGRSLWIEKAAQPIVGGMSGSPIILPDGGAVGMVCVSAEGEIYPAGPNPMLAASLPAWLLEESAT